MLGCSVGQFLQPSVKGSRHRFRVSKKCGLYTAPTSSGLVFVEMELASIKKTPDNVFFPFGAKFVDRYTKN